MFAGLSFVWGKAHVPLHKAQVCHKGVTLTVGIPALVGHLRHGDFQLPSCDFNNVFRTGDDCSDVEDVDGDGLGDFDDRDSAEGVTEACPVGTF